MGLSSISGRFKRMGTRSASPPPALEPHPRPPRPLGRLAAARPTERVDLDRQQRDELLALIDELGPDEPAATTRREPATAPAKAPTVKLDPARPPTVKLAHAPAAEPRPTRRAPRVPAPGPADRLGAPRFALLASLVVVAAGAVGLAGRAARVPRSPVEATGTVAPAATAAEAVVEPLVDEEPAEAEPAVRLPEAREVRWDAGRRALVVVDVLTREELRLGAWDVSRVKDEGGAQVTLELWGGDASLEVPRELYERLPPRERLSMDYGASGNLRAEDAAPPESE